MTIQVRQYWWQTFIVGMGIVIALSTSLLVTLALVGWFSRFLVVLVAVVSVALSLWILRTIEVPSTTVATRDTAAWYQRGTIVLIVLFTIVTALFFHGTAPRRDDAIYAATGAIIAREGALTFHDAYAASVNGFQQTPDGSYTAQFFPGYSALLAAGGVFAGTAAYGAVTLLLIVVGLGALGLVARELGGHASAQFTVTALAVSSFVFHWFPRRTVSEVLLFALFWVGTYAVLRGIRERNYALLFLAGLPFVAIMTVRVEGILYTGLFTLVVVWAVRRDAYRTSAFRLPALLLLVVMTLLTLVTMLWYAVAINPQYVVSQWKGAATMPIVGGLAALLITVFIGYRWKKRLRVLVQTIVHPARVMAALVGAAICTMVLIAPFFSTLPGAIVIPLYTIHVLTLFGVLPLLLAVAWSRPAARTATILILLLSLPAFLLLINPHIRFDLPWYLRRFFPIFIPLVLLFAGTALSALRIRRVARIILLSGVLLVQFALSRSVIAVREYDGLNDQLEATARRFAADDLILVAPSAERDWMTALRYQHGLNVRTDIFTEPLTDERRTAITNASNVLVLGGEEYPSLLLGTVPVVERESIQLTTYQLTPTNSFVYNALIRQNDVETSTVRNASGFQAFPDTWETMSVTWRVFEVTDRAALLSSAQEWVH